MTALLSRNLKVYFRDKASVFFSLLAVMIIFSMYLLFLGDVWISNLPKVEGVKTLMDNWIMSGLLAVTSVTTVMGAFGTMVDDRSQKIMKDFSASPISRAKLVAGYELASFTVGAIMSLLAFALSELYIVFRGGALLPPLSMLAMVGLILLASMCNTAMISFLISFFKSQNAFGTASSILGTLVGFLTGIYLPVGMLPDAMQLVVKIFPVSHAALLMRNVMMRASLEQVFGNAPAAMVREFEEQMGVVFRFGDQAVSGTVSLLILAGTTVLFYGLSTLHFRQKSR
ncbi:MAG TPA: ABC transporter permease [Candidatus Limiplasma sp.]|nr:ABC transporter permease [Candidatus Limiplasma sp.]HPS81471.1 ABC transporter permease [Candidatus Limiplasma sp.]